MLTPLDHHQLLLLWLQLAVLLAAARGLGALARRIGQPAVVGELLAGVVVGPTILGRVSPGLFAELFPGGDVQSGLLLSISWLGILLLLVTTGFETDLGLLRRLGRPAALVSTGSLVVPLAFGFGLGWLLPDDFVGAEGDRLVFALFLAVALSISALPVVAKVLSDMGLMRRNVGQITIAAGVANDLVGWLLLGGVIGFHSGGDAGVIGQVVTFGAVLAFVGLSLTVGQRVVDGALRRARSSAQPFSSVLGTTVLSALVAGAATQALGVEAVMGAFIAGIVVGRSRYLSDDVRHALEGVSRAVFAPIFFATAGLYVDLGAVLSPSVLLWTVVIIAVAGAAKLIGSFAGGRVAGLSNLEGLAVGIGLNARGALEIVVATLGYGLGILNDTAYAAIVVLAISTSVMAGPLLRPVLRRLETRPDEAERLEQEEMLRQSVIAKATSALLPTRGGLNSVVAARLLDLSLREEADVTVLLVHGEQGRPLPPAADEVRLPRHRVERRTVHAVDVGGAILAESDLGHDLIAIGLNDDFSGLHGLSAPIRDVIAGAKVPLLLVRRGAHVTDLAHLDIGRLRTILVPVTGTAVGRAAEEIAHTIARGADARVEGVHIVTKDGRSGDGAQESASTVVDDQMRRAEGLAARMGGRHPAQVTVRHAPSAARGLLRAADDTGADLIVLGAEVRSHEGAPFLGYGTEYLLERATQTVVVVVLPGPLLTLPD